MEKWIKEEEENNADQKIKKKSSENLFEIASKMTKFLVFIV